VIVKAIPKLLGPRL